MRVHLENWFQKETMYLTCDFKLNVTIDVIEAHIYNDKEDRLMPYNTISGDLRREIIEKLYKEIRTLDIEV